MAEVPPSQGRVDAMSQWKLTVTAGPAEGEQVTVDDDLTIGRGASPAGRLGGDKELSRRHARLYVDDGRLLVKDLGSTNGTFVDDRRIDAPTEIGPGVTVQLGASALRLDDVPSPDPVAEDPEATTLRAAPSARRSSSTPGSGVTLTVVSGPAAGLVVALGAEPFVIGRSEKDDGALGGDPELSRSHARVSPLDGRFVVEDLGSTHGTFVNGKRIPAPTVLASGDALTVGSSALRLTVAGDKPAAVAGPPAPPAASKSGEGGILGRLADVSIRFPKRVLVIVGIFFVVAAVFGAPVIGVLAGNDGGFDDPDSESSVTDVRLAEAAGEQPGAGIVVLVRAGAPVDDPAVRQRVEALEAIVKAEPVVKRTASLYSTESRGFVSKDGKSTYIAAFMKNADEASIEEAATRITEKISKPPGVLLGGSVIADSQLGEQVGMDLGKAEGLAFPILFALSLFVFRGFVAALLPLFVGFLTVVATFFALRLINVVVELSPFAVNVVIALGLGLAIDYTLFIVNRYREELYKLGVGVPAGDDPEGGPDGAQAAPDESAARAEALRRAVGTAGRTIVYSSVTVAIAMAALITFPQGFLSSMGIGGAVCAMIAVTVALVALPALLAALGPRLDKGAPKRWREASLRTASQERAGNWYRLAQAIMRRPAAVAAISAAFLVLLALPALGIKFTGVDSSVIPKDLSSRQVSDALRSEFSRTVAEVTVLAEAPRSAGAEVKELAARLTRLPGANSKVESPARPLAGGLWELTVTPVNRALDPATIDLVKQIRALDSPIKVSVAGETAAFIDQRAAIARNLPLAVILLCSTTLIVLFLMTGSVVLPLKSLVMNFLSVGAAFGLLVLIFQNGNLEGVLGFESPGALDISQPVLLFAIAFGLSTDYAVFLLTRIKEAREAGASETESVAIGLERTGRIVTQAALLFCVAIGAFATSSVIFIKEVGVGTALAVIIDATIIRAFLVPSLMALLGARNWWAPGPLRRLHDKIGLKEG
ncbi:MAG: MMPL family transporter [Solirubrobacteraceae bacterium]